MKERVRFADGKVAAATWEDYPILRFSEVPEIEIELIDNAERADARDWAKPRSDRPARRSAMRSPARSASASAICR